MNLKEHVDTISKIIAILVVFISAIFAYAYRDAQIEEQAQRIKFVEEQIANFPKIENNEKSILNLDGRVSNVEISLNAMSSDMAVLKANYHNIDGKLDQIYGMLDKLDSKFDKLREQK